MKIVFCTPGNIKFADYLNGNLLGTEFQVFGISQELVKRGHEIYIIRRWHKKSEKRETIAGVNFINLYVPNIQQKYIEKILFSESMCKEVYDVNPDVLVLTEILSSYFVCTVRKPKIYVTHNNPGDLYLSTNFLHQKIKKLVEKKVFGNCDAIVALNNEIERYLSNHGYNSLIIPNAVELEKYKIKSSENNYIMYGGRFDKIKGIDILIEAYSKLSNEEQKMCKLLLVGDGPDKQNIIHLIKNFNITNNVIFISWLPSKKFIEQISECLFFVLPSYSECMPVSLIEAMALGKPVIASNIPGIKDIISHGYDGFLFEKGNATDLKKYLSSLIINEGLRLKLSKNAKKKVESLYSFNKTALEYEILFSNFLEFHNDF